MTGVPVDGTREAIPAAADTGLDDEVLRESVDPALLLMLAFTNVFVPAPDDGWRISDESTCSIEPGTTIDKKYHRHI